MRFETEIKQWGNSLGLRITGSMAQEPMFAKGVPVVVETTDQGMTVKVKQKPKPFTMPFTESELVAGLTAYDSSDDLLPQLTDKEIEGWTEDTYQTEAI